MNLSLESLVILLIVAGLAGALGQSLAGYSRGGLFTSIALGFIGALLGTWLARQFRLPVIFALQIGGTHFPVVWAIIGAMVCVAILGVRSRRRRYDYDDG